MSKARTVKKTAPPMAPQAAPAPKAAMPPPRRRIRIATVAPPPSAATAAPKEPAGGVGLEHTSMKPRNRDTRYKVDEPNRQTSGWAESTKDNLPVIRRRWTEEDVERQRHMLASSYRCAVRDIKYHIVGPYIAYYLCREDESYKLIYRANIRGTAAEKDMFVKPPPVFKNHDPAVFRFK